MEPQPPIMSANRIDDLLPLDNECDDTEREDGDADFVPILMNEIDTIYTSSNASVYQYAGARPRSLVLHWTAYHHCVTLLCRPLGE